MNVTPLPSLTVPPVALTRLDFLLSLHTFFSFQDNFDKGAIPIFPSEFSSPLLHAVISEPRSAHSLLARRECLHKAHIYIYCLGESNLNFLTFHLRDCEICAAKETGRPCDPMVVSVIVVSWAFLQHWLACKRE